MQNKQPNSQLPAKVDSTAEAVSVERLRSAGVAEAARIKALVDMNKGKCHMLTPMISTEFKEVAPYHVGSHRIVYISTDEEDQQIYEVRKGRWALAKLGLEKLDQLAGIVWIPQTKDVRMGTVRGTYVQYDPREPEVATGIAEGYVIDIDGSKREACASRTIDLRDESSETKKILKENPSGFRLQSYRANICQMAETKAKNRVRRELLGLPSSFRKEAFNKPFFVLKLVPNVASIIREDPVLKAQYQARLLGVSHELHAQPPSEPISIPIEDVSTPMVEPPLDTSDLRVVSPPTEEEQRATQIERINALYMRKLNAPRGQDRVPLSKLTADELDTVEDVLKEKPDHPEWVKQNPDSIL